MELSNLFNEMDASAWIEIATVAVLALILIVVSQRALSWTANRLHDRPRFLVFAVIPLTRLLILVAAAIWIVPIVIEPSLQNMVALLGAVGIAIGFALKDYVSSLIAGLVSAFELPYRPGDWIEVNGVYGEVKHVGTRTVELVTPDDTWVSIPHLKLWNEAIHNANNGGPSLQCVANFYLQRDHDASAVSQILSDVALTSPFLEIDKPIVVITQERPFGTHYRVKAYPIDPRQQFRFISDLTLRGKAALQRLDVAAAITPLSIDQTAS
ncbi:MAG: mechanosensitive ion channel family protein [Thioalkalivibrio sp.]|nr:mechanosensitive ion channel family protein [Thioalkalivibrio sp.]